MTREEFIERLKLEKPESFLESQLLRRNPEVFTGDEENFFAWRSVLSKLIDVDPSCILLIGSSATGFSLNPYKNFKAFDAASDIDVAIVSPQHFNVSWRFLRMNSARMRELDYSTKSAWKEHSSNYVYWGTIATDKLLGVLPFGKQWLQAASNLAAIDPTKNRDIKFRIYYDHDALRSYHLKGVTELRNAILAGD